jgi:hypothetical protein
MWFEMIELLLIKYGCIWTWRTPLWPMIERRWKSSEVTYPWFWKTKEAGYKIISEKNEHRNLQGFINYDQRFPFEEGLI